MHGIAIVPPGCERDALGPLPVAALRIAPALAAALAEVGVLRVDQLLQLDRDEIAIRFASAASRGASGAARSNDAVATAEWSAGEVLLSSACPTTSDADTDGDPLVRIDQALGLRPERLIPASIVPGIRIERRFDGPVTSREVLERTVDDLIDGLCARLRSDERGVRHLRLEAERADASPVAIDLHLGRLTRRCAHLRAILRPHLETLPLGFGLDGMALAAIRTGRLRHRQSDLLDATSASSTAASSCRRGSDAEADPGAAGPPRSRTRTRTRVRSGAPLLPDSVIECLDVLAGRLGRSSIRGFTGVDLGLAERFPECGVPSERVGRRSPAGSGSPCGGAARPTLLFAAPEPLQVRWLRAGDAALAHPIASSRNCAADRLVARWLDPGGVLDLAAIGMLRWRDREHRVHDCSGFERVDEPWWWTRWGGGERHRCRVARVSVPAVQSAQSAQSVQSVQSARSTSAASAASAASITSLASPTSHTSWRPVVRLHLRVRLASGLLLWVRCDPVGIAIHDSSGHRRGSDACAAAVWSAHGAWA